MIYVCCSVCSVVCPCQLFCSAWMCWRYTHVCNCDVFSVVNVYLDQLNFNVVYINGRRYVCCDEYNVSLMCDEPTPVLCTPSVPGFLNCDDICTCVLNKQFELLEFVFDSVYVRMADLQKTG